MINILEISFDGLAKSDYNRRKLQKQRRKECAKFLGKYKLILYSRNKKQVNYAEKEAGNLEVFHIANNNLSLTFEVYRTAVNIMKANHIDIISTTDPFACGFVGCLLKVRFKVPLNVQLHFDYFSKYYWIDRWQMKKFFGFWLAKMVIGCSNTIRVVSVLQKRRLEKIIGKRKLIEVVPTPVDLESMNPFQLNADLCAKYRTSNQTKLLLYVGRLEEIKDLAGLLKAFQLVQEAYDDVNLLIIGIGSEEAKLKKISIDLDIDRKVLFLGSVNHSEIFSYYHGADIFVISSKAEGRSTVLTEAALSKKSIVATKFLGAQELIVNGQTGFVVDVGDYKAFAEKVLILLNNPEMMREFGEKAYEHVSKKIEKINDIKILVHLWEETVKTVAGY